MRNIIKAILIAIASIYLLLCAAIYFHQTKFIFVPQREVESTPREYGCSFEDVQFDSGGKRLRGWWLPGDAKSSALVNNDSLIYFHGNGGSIGANAAHACRLSRIGFGVLLFDYRGYGNSEGRAPTEQAVYEDAEQAWNYLALKHGMRQDKLASNVVGNVVIYGHSLGGAVAVEMATRHPEAAALIAESTFTSIQEMSEQSPVFRYFPNRLILNQHMDSLKKIASVHMPVLLIHGTADSVVPSTMAEKIYAAVPGRKQIFLVPGAGHENCAAVAGAGYANAVVEFMKTVPVAAQASAGR